MGQDERPPGTGASHPLPGERPPFHVDPSAMSALTRLWEAGHAAWLVGGAVRNALLTLPASDWDVATDARPERVLELFGGGTYENRFGTVLADGIEITTFRRDHRYADHRRPDEVTFTDDVLEDLARRDLTINAICWGRSAAAAQPGLLDPHGGLDDLRDGLVRAVGDPSARFEEDALRLLRAVRICVVLRFRIEPRTLDAIRRHAPDVRFVAAERVAVELRRLLAAPEPSGGLRLLRETGLLVHLLPEVDRQVGIPQDKVPGLDLYEHTLATVDAAARLAPGDERLLLAALLHDCGKPDTLHEGHFIGHAEQGAGIARGVLARMRYPGRDSDVIGRLIEEHMFSYVPEWSDAAVRRFMRRLGMDLLRDLLRLREADNLGSGQAADHGRLAELRGRIDGQLAAGAPLSLSDLAVDGDLLCRELGLSPSPVIGRLLDQLLESVIGDPSRNTRRQLLADAHAWLRMEHASTQRPPRMR